MILRVVEYQWTRLRWSCFARFVEQLEGTGTDRHWNAHDDALTNSGDLVFLSVVGGVEKVVGRSLKLRMNENQ